MKDIEGSRSIMIILFHLLNFLDLLKAAFEIALVCFAVDRMNGFVIYCRLSLIHT